MIKYERDPDCECSAFNIYGRTRWSNGYIHQNGAVRECSCHAKWRRRAKIETLLENARTSWSLDDILKYEPVGRTDYYKNFIEKLPKRIKDKNSIMYINGPASSQKTVIMLKALVNVAYEGHSVAYWTMPQLLSEITKLRAFNTDKDEAAIIEDTIKNLINKDFVIIDDMFQVNRSNNIQQYPATTLTTLEDLISSRKGTTVLISQIDPDEDTLFSGSFHSRLKSRIISDKSYFEFNDVPKSLDIEEALDDGSFWN